MQFLISCSNVENLQVLINKMLIRIINLLPYFKYQKKKFVHINNYKVGKLENPYNIKIELEVLRGNQ